MSVEGRYAYLKLQPVLHRWPLRSKIRRERCCASVEVPASCCAKLNNRYWVFVLSGLLRIAKGRVRGSLPASRRTQKQKQERSSECDRVFPACFPQTLFTRN